MANLRIVFRTDANQQIGTGHFMRCLTLADELRLQNAEISFVARRLPTHLQQMLIERAFKYYALNGFEDAKPIDELPHASWLQTSQANDADLTLALLGAGTWDWLVVDHYALDYRFEKPMRSLAQNILVIDDLADRVHDCDALLDQNLGRSESDYDGLVNLHASKLIGPHYALLRPEFVQLRPQSLTRRIRPQLKNILITMGGVDNDNATGQVLQALFSCGNLPNDLRITVVMGTDAPYLDEVQLQAALMPWPTTVLVGIKNIAECMSDSDLCIGAAGSTSWERCCLGLPTIQLTLAINQSKAANALIQMEAVLGIMRTSKFLDDLKLMIEKIDPIQLFNLSSRSAQVTNGVGAGLVCKHLMNLTD